MDWADRTNGPTVSPMAFAEMLAQSHTDWRVAAAVGEWLLRTGTAEVPSALTDLTG
ncbi:hypothetical protein [Streptomyces sp. NPDC059918]|uniref:hypothetical protein n=1 Tax=unclassified Streptomyces TaxID=2593676 RepID=UPI0036679E1E